MQKKAWIVTPRSRTFSVEAPWLFFLAMKEDMPGTSLPFHTIKGPSHRNCVYKQLNPSKTIKCLPAYVSVLLKTKANQKQQSLTKRNIVLPYNPAIVLLDIYLTDLKTYILHMNISSSFIHDLPNWKQL